MSRDGAKLSIPIRILVVGGGEAARQQGRGEAAGTLGSCCCERSCRMVLRKSLSIGGSPSHNQGKTDTHIHIWRTNPSHSSFPELCSR